MLLVEDTLSQQKLMSKWLHGQGCDVVCAVNGKIGLELLKIKQFDIAFIDFLMVRKTNDLHLKEDVCDKYLVFLFLILFQLLLVLYVILYYVVLCYIN